MRHVVLHAMAHALQPAAAYERISDFRRYPELTDTVREVLVQAPLPDGSVVSEWTVSFRNGLMRWRERDAFSPETLSITFEQLTGDFEVFNGSWHCAPRDGGTLITFAADFDLGIPTLSEIIDPVAESTLRTNIARILHGLTGAEIVEEAQGEPAVAARG
ncbi:MULTISPECIES: SRPBCC family protein [Streptomycetaceae]|uniref:Coenzyme Q-binding protein COQ10 START domain-containing protein n=1 Tax=Streptantibioticus cattleyicolor (strain ATCC 35852 / DSM 46488 / JCM 4925 / NBRC 14057 / NRRL 8057) TaxID=1003195 RepID=F8JSQ5_STREN|nr:MULTISPECIES: SRPBCC family protein [Streptomycetaceae]AEW97961.1 hypothetical protein SCATT_55900 [Streptantibioticus cattleyicolor NRRL 8057 = DSM 46488]MYS62364.1 cyclase [Streptomyces sp. SID5468]CCB78279.1 conserved protein of unknown function [Streptantibioticus cattleyicolor NRRL 8057 = DSM 46488]